jgi:uncharacterized protein with HEPN domain
VKDLQLLHDILEAIEAIEKYTVATFNDFVSDSKTQDAILYNLIIVGEAANRISEQFRDQHSTIPWSSMIGTRNIIVHGYDQVRLQIIWGILQGDLADLKSKVEKILIEL